EPGAAQRRYLWHRCGSGAGATAVDRCGGRHRQNQDAGAPGGAADPRRRRSASFVAVDLYPPRRARMTRRAQQILIASQRGRAAGGAEGARLPWSGTFHSIGNRLLRRHAATLSLDPAFTVLDRADSADLIDLVRSDLGLARTRSRFPK